MSDWIDVKQELPPPHFQQDMLAWIPNEGKDGGYREIVAYGEYICENEDIQPDDPNYIEDNDEGNMRGFGWHREEDTHGGPYDTVFINLNQKVTHWMPLPAPPKP